MTLPNDPDVGEVAEENDLSLLDEKILTVLRAADAPVLTSTEVKEQGIRKSRRTVHDHLEDLEQLGLVRHKRAGDGDRTPKVWWLNEDRIGTGEDEPPGKETVIEGLEAMLPHERRLLRSEFPEFEGKKPPLLHWSIRGVIGGSVTLFLVAALEILRVTGSVGFMPDLTLVGIFGILSIVAGMLGSVAYAISLVEMTVRDDSRHGNTTANVLQFSRYGFVGGVFLSIAGIAAENTPMLRDVATVSFVGGIILVLLSLTVVGAIWLYQLLQKRQNRFSLLSSS